MRLRTWPRTLYDVSDSRPVLRSLWSRTRSVLETAILFAACLGFAVAVLGVFFGGWQASPVLSGSMDPGIPTGGVVITKMVPVADVQVGDIIMFRDPEQSDLQVVHRVVERRETPDGPLFRTKGDAKSSTGFLGDADPRRRSPRGASVPAVSRLCRRSDPINRWAVRDHRGGCCAAACRRSRYRRWDPPGSTCTIISPRRDDRSRPGRNRAPVFCGTANELNSVWMDVHNP